MLDELSMQARDAHRFDESLGTWRAITDDEPPDEGGLAPAARVEADVYFRSSPGGSVAEGYYASFMPYASGIAMPAEGSSQTSVPLGGSALGGFPKLADLGVMSMSLAVTGRRDEGEVVWWRFGRASFLFTKASGVTFSHHGLSYGQKRLLAFLYYLDANPSHVIADEFVNGMHHAWITACRDALLAGYSPRQSFLTSQNPLLLDYIPLHTADDARRTFVQCRAELIDGRERFVWNNLELDDATELFADHQVGVQHLGELLRVRGLW